MSKEEKNRALPEWHLFKAIVRILRHSRAGGNPAVFAGILDSRLRGNDGMLSFCGISSELIE
jgi:hypothetical protein